MSNSLQGKRIVITRPRHKADSFAEQLKRYGAEPVIIPTIEILPAEDFAPLDSALQNLSGYDMVLFTSANTVHHIWLRLEALEISPDLKFPPVAAIGKATANALKKHHIDVALIPEKHTAEGLFALLAEKLDLKGKRFLLPQSQIARAVLGQSLGESGAIVDEVIAYCTVKPEIDPALLTRPFDVITFTSPSAVQNFYDCFEHPKTIIGEARIACIGPVTAEAVRALNLPVHVMAEPCTIDGLITALCQYFERNNYL